MPPVYSQTKANRDKMTEITAYIRIDLFLRESFYKK